MLIPENLVAFFIGTNGKAIKKLMFDANTEIGIVEMGANHQKEIEFLCKIAQPDYGYITNFGKAHLEGFKSFEGVQKTKSEMYDYLEKFKCPIFYNEDDNILKKNLSQRTSNLISYSTNNNSYIRGIDCFSIIISKVIYMASSTFKVLNNSPILKWQ